MKALLALCVALLVVHVISFSPRVDPVTEATFEGNHSKIANNIRILLNPVFYDAETRSNCPSTCPNNLIRQCYFKCDTVDECKSCFGDYNWDYNGCCVCASNLIQSCYGISCPYYS